MDGYCASRRRKRGHGISVVDWYVQSCEYRQTYGKPCPKSLPHILVGVKLERLVAEVNRCTAEFLEGDHRFVPLLIIIHDDLLITALTDDEARVTPTEVIHTPEGINRKEEAVYGIPGIG